MGLSHVKISACHAELDSASCCTALYNGIPDRVRNDKLSINMRQPHFYGDEAASLIHTICANALHFLISKRYNFYLGNGSYLENERQGGLYGAD